MNVWHRGLLCLFVFSQILQVNFYCFCQNDEVITIEDRFEDLDFVETPIGHLPLEDLERTNQRRLNYIEDAWHMLPQEGPVRLKKCKNGLFLYTKNDIYVGRSLDLYGEWSDAEMSVFQALLRPGDVVIEVGAHLGVFTVPLAKMVGPSGRVYALEPQRSLYQLLNANLSLNGITNTYALKLVAGKTSGTTSVPDFDSDEKRNYGGISMVEPWKQVAPVEVVHMTRIDDLYIGTCRFLKVEGKKMEVDILEGARNLILRHRPFLYVENDAPERHGVLTHYIISLGYVCHWVITPLFVFNNYFQEHENVFGNIGTFNMLCHDPKMHKLDLPSQFSIVDPSHHPLE